MNLNNIFALMGLIGAAQSVVQSVQKLVTLLTKAGSDVALKGALAAAPHTAAAVADISAKLRAVQESAGHVGSDKNLLSKASEVQRLIGHVSSLRQAFTTDTHDPAVLSELSASPVLQAWIGEVVQEWGTVQGGLGAFRL